jgi:hypothetical protein
MKSLMSLVQDVAQELGTWCRISTTFDCKTIERRVKDEGLSFLTITLPNFGADLQKGLAQGKVDSQLFQGFSHGRGCLPLFLGGFIGLIFDRATGLLLDDPSVDAIFAVRQITLMCSKVAMTCTPKRVRQSIDKYIECEQEVKNFDALLSPSQREDFVRVSRLLWADVLSKTDKSVYDGDILPKHGPGSTADGLKGNHKFHQTEWTRRLEEYFPHGEFLFPNWRFYDADRVHLLEPGSERPVKVITVPKTLKTPRIIAVEPTAMQYVQQGIKDDLVDAISRDDILGSVVGFDDQEVNQFLARQGSSDGSLATLDLSEASDRVSNQLVRLLLKPHPHLARGVDACRSRKADVPGYGVKRLAKFASMGSALTFPIEAMIFTVIIFIGIQSKLSRPLTRRDIKSLRGQVRVYGDDIIVPADYVRSVVEALETFGFKVNLGKSFWTGKFRESCGKEYYDGHDVSIVKVRQDLPAQRTDVLEIISTVSLRNQFYELGLWSTTSKLDQWLERVIPLPTVLPTSPVLGRHSKLGFVQEKMCPKLHRPLVKGFVVSSSIPARKCVDGDALLKVFLKRGELPFVDRKHLERSGRPQSVDIKLRWASAT